MNHGVKRLERSADSTAPVVLHVEDDPAFAHLLSARLERCIGADVRHAESPSLAMKALHEFSPDAVVSDFSLPGTDGIEFLTDVADETDAPRFLLASESKDDVIDEAMETGVDGYFAKSDSGVFRRLGTSIETAIACRQAMADLQESERIRRTLTNTLPGLVYRKEAAGGWRPTYLSDACVELTGYDPEVFLAGDLDWVDDLVHEPDASRLESVAKDAFAARESYEETYRITRADGAIRYIREYGTGIFEGDDLVAIEGYIRDVTEEYERRQEIATHRDTVRQLHEAAVRIETCETNAEVFETLVESAQEILEFDICAVNQEEDGTLPIAAISDDTPPNGYSPMSVEEGIVGKAYRQGRPIVTPDITSATDANPQGPYKSALTVPIGQYGVFQAVSHDRYAFDRNDLDLAQVLIDHAVTTLERLEREQALKERERELRQQNERLEEFAGILSHDLRNPLSVARGWTDLLDADPEKVDRIKAAHERMATIIDDVLELAREGDPVTETEETDLETAAKRAWGVVATQDASLVVDSDVVLETEPDRFGRLLENLFSNAVEHAGPSVTVRIGPTEHGFYIEDDGPGIPPEQREEVFESGVSTEENGTGFGLAIVKSVVEAHDWAVTLTESPTGGARFEIDVAADRSD